jgi:hypothetical protein
VQVEVEPMKKKPNRWTQRPLVVAALLVATKHLVY